MQDGALPLGQAKYGFVADRIRQRMSFSVKARLHLVYRRFVYHLGPKERGSKIDQQGSAIRGNKMLFKLAVAKTETVLERFEVALDVFFGEGYRSVFVEADPHTQVFGLSFAGDASNASVVFF